MKSKLVYAGHIHRKGIGYCSSRFVYFRAHRKQFSVTESLVWSHHHEVLVAILYNRLITLDVLKDAVNDDPEQKAVMS